MNVRASWLTLALIACALTGCHELRDRDGDPDPTYEDVAPIFARACTRCHGASKAEAGVDLSRYLAAIGCTERGEVLSEPANERAPLLAVLAREDHRELLSRDESERLKRWVRAGAPAFRGTVHEPSIIDPRSERWHGKLVAANDWALLRDAKRELACGRCHAGAPVRPEGVRFAAPSAPPCTSCHTEENGVLACTTCHGTNGKPYAARDACFFEPRGGDAHAAHLTQKHFRTKTLNCTDCHPVPGDALFGGSHANGTLDVRITDPAAGPDARFDESSMQCAVGCHDQGGAFTRPTWEARDDLDCQSCHASPPADHYPGPCSTCHREMGSAADSLTPGPFHLDGVVELGDGSGTCGACHGDGTEAWPTDATHQAHRRTLLTDSVACTSCHVVPSEVRTRGHLDGEVTVRLAGAAQGPTLSPRFDGDTKTCSEVACHGAGMRTSRGDEPRWGEASAGADLCNRCHSAPPPPPHVQLASCGGGLCHDGEVGPDGDNLRISPSGRALHIDGRIEAGREP